ncbi:ABC transporter permease [Pontibacillus sp. HMF3514]|uniref:ABC transporter permease n=1 Tax=Pontibacillus sp. HMF3514 TaxID=2692425 RepID=UPI00131FCF32|nr:FtsX-like permease family protein [Pontibacillus sp. HMF3514]QHE52651.1 FtsX-like permease family protein [Pontibacillus sp. HMF3514]
MILRKSILRHITEKKFQYFGVIVLLLISIMLYVSMSMAISTLDTRNQQFKESYNQEDFHFIVSEDIHEEQLSAWEDNFDVQLEKRSYTDVEYQSEDTTLRVFSLTDEINKPYISEGELPEKQGEIAVSPPFAKAHNLKVGDSINVNNQELKVTGMMYLPDYIYILERVSDLINDPKSFGLAITGKDTLNNLSNKSVAQVMGEGLSEEEIASFKDNVVENYSLLRWMNSNENPRIEFVESEIESSEAVITTLPLFILVLSVMMVLMILKRQLDLQRKEIGTLMALGYRKKELMRHYLSHAGVIGIIGTLLGLIAGAVLSIPFTNLYSEYYNLPSISYFDWDVMVLVIGFIVPNVVLLIMTYFVIRKPLKQSPLDLLSPKDVSKGKKSMFERLPFFKKGNFISRFRLRLLVRKKTRAIYIFIGVMFSSILLIFGFVTYNSMDDIVETTYKKIFTYDYGVYYNSLQQGSLEEGASPFTNAEISVQQLNGKEDIKVDQKVSIYGVKPESDQIQLLNDDEEILNERAEKGFVVSKPLASVLELEKGDELTIGNAYNDKTITKVVEGVANVYIGFSVYYQLDEVNSFIGYPEGVYTAKWTNTEPGDSGNILYVENKKDAIENFESTSELTRYSVMGIAGFAFLIGVIVLTLITNLIVEENSPSISLLKVMGYKDNEISKMVLNVYTPIVFITYMVSIPIAYYSIDGMMTSLVEQTGFSLPVNLNWFMIVLGFVIIMVTYFVSLWISKRKLKKVSLQEALKKQQD